MRDPKAMINSLVSKVRIIFEIANNHQGSLNHFENILKDISKSVKNYHDNFEFLIKFQFRDIPTFIDQTIDPSTNKHISRFKDTQLSLDEWKIIFSLVKSSGFKLIITPFHIFNVD